MQHARLDKWHIKQYENGTFGLVGIVSSHPDTIGCPDGTLVYTSRLQGIDFKEGCALTMNTEYDLGKPAA